MPRGGSRRRCVPHSDPLLLLNVMDNHVKIKGVSHAFSLGSYEQIRRSHGACGPGLAQNSDLLEALLNVAPAGHLKPSVLRGHLMTLANKYNFLCIACPDLAKLVVCHKADCIMTMLCHLRRVRMHAARARAMMHKSFHCDVIAVEHLCNLLELPNVPACDMESYRDACQAAGPGRCCKCKDAWLQSRPLKRKASNTPWTGYTAADWAAMSASDADMAANAVCQLSTSSRYHS